MEDVRLRRPLVFLDLETTGTSPRTDRIVEIAALKLLPDGGRDLRWRRVHPERPIPPEATLVHGISDADVADQPPFRRYAKGLLDFLADCDFAGYNLDSFDLPMLQEEFKRAGLAFTWRDRAVVDALSIFRLREPHDLGAAVRFYCGDAHPRPHAAKEDVLATMEVLKAQLARYPDLPREI